jgi:hypothetical protein
LICRLRRPGIDDNFWTTLPKMNNTESNAITVSPDDQAIHISAPTKTPRKRKRVVISCTECHRRKQKVHDLPRCFCPSDHALADHIAQCDRDSPCSNCVGRGKDVLCHYENEAARKRQLMEESSNANGSDEGLAFKVMKLDSAAQISAFGYSESNGNNNTTFGIFKKIEHHDGADAATLTYPISDDPENSALADRYKGEIRRLPPKGLMEKLLDTYFREVNHHYFPLDQGIFYDLLKSWNDISFASFKKVPIGLSPDLQFFPALVFGTLALALQFQPPDYDPSLDTLKYLKGMSFDDVASEYSEAGKQILCMLGKRSTTLVAVQARFLRTTYLKNCGQVPESWHSLSETIRDAQEIGLHKDTDLQIKQAESPGDVLEHLWLVQLRRRMWTILTVWDVHMAIVLGRPTTIDARDSRAQFPIDAPIPKNRREVAPQKRTASDPPTPLTMLLWMAETCAPLWDIFNLEKEDPHQNNFAKVEKMHSDIRYISLQTPPYFRAENPDTTFDSHPDCYWLPRARPTFQSNTAFTVMALHRPYIFTNANSRTLALNAGLDILRAQREIFNLLKVKDYKMFHLVLNTFDAMVLIAAIYILHPNENRSDLDSTLQHFEWGLERFQKMRGRNMMAESALAVMKAIYIRLKKALNASTACNKPSFSLLQSAPPISTSPQNATPESYSTSLSSASSTNLPSENLYAQPTVPNLVQSAIIPTSSSWDAYSGRSIPENFDFSSMAPLQPLHDLLDLKISTVGDSQMLDPQMINDQMGLDGRNDAWQFEGDFGNDSFWGFMNNYTPS